MQKLIKEFNNIESLVLDKNYGYAGAMNKGLEYTVDKNNDFILFINNDIIVHPQFLKNLLISANNYGKDNIYGSKIYYYNNPKMIWFIKATIHLSLGIIKHDFIRKIDNGKTEEMIIESDYITGCCMLISKDVLKKIEGFNPIYNMYCEDVDLCLRANKLGIKSLVITNSIIWHKVSSSIGGNLSIKKNVKKIISLYKLLNIHANFYEKICGYPSIIILNLLKAPIYIYHKYFNRKIEK